MRVQLQQVPLKAGVSTPGNCSRTTSGVEMLCVLELWLHGLAPFFPTPTP